MSIGTVFIYVTFLVLVSPVIWVAWWLISDLAHPYRQPAYRHVEVAESRRHRTA